MAQSKDYMAEAKNILEKDKRDILLITTKSSVNGAITGLIIGLMVGYYKQKNIYVSGIIGAVAGAAISGLLIHKKD